MPTRQDSPSFNDLLGDAADPGSQFQGFIAQLFADEFPGLIGYAGPGRDGGIDLFHPDSGTVFECKYLGEDGADAAEQRWNKTRGFLEKNLLPGQPKQSQYAPWYNRDTPIAVYRFCTSQRVENESRRQALQGQIQAFFRQLAAGDPSLGHLAQLQVELWSWDRLAPRLAQYPALRLRWFGRDTPRGLEALEADTPLQGNFRDYSQPAL